MSRCPEVAAQYAALSSNTARSDFRREWAEKEYHQLMERKEKVERLSSMYRDKGIYKPIPVIVRDEGGDEAARRAAKLYCQKCLAMGGPWVRFNSMTERLEFLHMEKQFIEEHERSWLLHCSETSTGSRPQGQEVPRKRARSEETVAGHQTGAPGGPAAAKQKAKQRVVAAAKAAPPSNPEAQDKKLLMSVFKVKQAAQINQSASVNLRSQIGSDDSWSWANHPTVLGQLQKAEEQLTQGLQGTVFSRDVMTLDERTWRDKYSKEQVAVEGKRFVDEIDPFVQDLAKAKQKILAMHLAAQRP